MQFVTDFADQAVVLPLALIVALALAVLGWWRGLAAWVMSVGLTMTLVLLLKLAGLALASVFGPSSVSGHVAAGCMVYAGLAVLLTGRAGVGITVLAVVAAVLGFTRVELQAHDWLEVACGMVLGGLGLAVLIATAGPRPRVPNWPIAAAALCTVLAMHGLHLPAETALQTAFASL